MSKPVIEVHYPGGEEPRVVLPPGLDAEVRLIDSEAEHLTIVEWKGVTIYATWRYQGIASDCWYSTISGLESDDEGTFDVRDIPVPVGVVSSYSEALRDKVAPEYLERAAALAYAIDKEWITPDGWTL
jgi:hypothetical protein